MRNNTPFLKLWKIKIEINFIYINYHLILSYLFIIRKAYVNLAHKDGDTPLSGSSDLASQNDHKFGSSKSAQCFKFWVKEKLIHNKL